MFLLILDMLNRISLSIYFCEETHPSLINDMQISQLTKVLILFIYRKINENRDVFLQIN